MELVFYCQKGEKDCPESIPLCYPVTGEKIYSLTKCERKKVSKHISSEMQVVLTVRIEVRFWRLLQPDTMLDVKSNLQQYASNIMLTSC